MRRHPQNAIEGDYPFTGGEDLGSSVWEQRKSRFSLGAPDTFSLRFLLAQDGAQEFPRAGLLRVAEEALGFALFDDASLVEEADAIRHLPGEAHLVRDQEHCQVVFAREITDDAEHFADQLRV
jgi:hypothetical protein